MTGLVAATDSTVISGDVVDAHQSISEQINILTLFVITVIAIGFLLLAKEANSLKKKPTNNE